MDKDTSTQEHPLLLLAARCEREEPTYALEMEIAIAAGGYARASTTGYTSGGIVWRGDAGTKCPAYCSSLDAAVTIVPETFKNFWLAGDESDVAKMFGRVGYEWIGNGHTVALSLCAAALRARAALAEEEAK